MTALADACLRTGAGGEAAGWAQQAIELEPFRETGYRLLMEAHAADGNRAEALRVYERCRRLLADELGAYPSPETESVYQRLLQAPPAPKRLPPERPAPGRPPTAGRGRRLARPRLLAAAALAVVVVAGVVAGVATTSGGQKQVAVPANSVVALDPNGSVTAILAVGAHPVAAVAAADSLWVANLEDRTVTRIDLSSRRILQSIPIGGAPTALATTPGAVWVSDATGQISRIDPEYDRPVPTRQLTAASNLLPLGTAWPMLPASRSIWIVDPDGYVGQFDPGTGRQTGSVDVGNEPSAVAAGEGSLWVTNSADGTVTRIDPATLVTTTIPVGHGPDAVAVNAAGVWVANAGDDALVRINPDTGAVAATASVGDGPAAVLATATALWVANARDGTVMRLDPRSGAVTKTIHLGGSPTALVSAAGRVWVTVAPAPQPPPVTPGTAHFTMQDDFPSLDPALAQTPTSVELFYATCADLVTYPDKPASAGSQIVPEVAETVPTPTDGGRTYTFTIRSGFRFSPPSNEAVTAQTFKATIERVVSPQLKSPFASQFSGVAGYHDYVTGNAPGLSGVVARGDTLTITLSQPDGSFLANLAGGAACAVPIGTPAVPGGLNDIPSAGPYYVESYSPRQQLVLRRNPNYRGDRPHHLDQMVFTIGTDSARALAEIKAGTADYAVDGLPRDAGPGLESQYGPDSKAARSGHQRYFISPANGVRILHMNTSRPLFSNVRLRLAVNYAIDRPALAAQGQRFAEVNPFNAGSPADSYMFPATAGAADFHLYPLAGPNLRRARQLAGNVHATAIMYTPDVPPWLQEAQIIRRDLQPLGIDVQLKGFPLDEFFYRVSHRGEPFDLAIAGWYSNIADPTQTLEMFDGSTISADDNGRPLLLQRPRIRPAAPRGGRAVRGQALPHIPPARSGTRTRPRAGGRNRDQREPRLLFRPDGLPALPAALRHRPGRAMPPEHGELTAGDMAREVAALGRLAGTRLRPRTPASRRDAGVSAPVLGSRLFGNGGAGWCRGSLCPYSPQFRHGAGELPVDLLELGDEVLDVAKLAIVADWGAFVAVACGWHAVAGSHEQGSRRGGRPTASWSPSTLLKVILLPFKRLVTRVASHICDIRQPI